MWRAGSTLLLLAACGLGCHGDVGDDPPNRPRIGGPVSDFPRADLGEDEGAPNASQGGTSRPGMTPSPQRDAPDGPAQEPAASGDAERDESAADAGTAVEPDAGALAAGAMDADASADTGASADAAAEGAGPASGDASQQADASLPCSDVPTACGDGG